MLKLVFYNGHVINLRDILVIDDHMFPTNKQVAQSCHKDVESFGERFRLD